MYNSTTFSTELELDLSKFEGQEKEFLNSLIEQLGLGQDDIYENCIYPTVEIGFSYNVNSEGIGEEEVENVTYSLGEIEIECPDFETYPSILKILEESIIYHVEHNFHKLIEACVDNSY
jgi:hypothetical protein